MVRQSKVSWLHVAIPIEYSEQDTLRNVWLTTKGILQATKLCTSQLRAGGYCSLLHAAGVRWDSDPRLAKLRALRAE